MSFIDSCIDTLRGLTKVALQSRPASVRSAERDGRIVILANGPSLAQTVENHLELLKRSTCMAVNFAANTEVFRLVRPQFYILADPYFFSDSNEPNLGKLWQNLRSVDYEMTLIVPANFKRRAQKLLEGGESQAAKVGCVRVVTFNAVGVEGFAAIRHILYKSRLAMPRPRNVLIAALMASIWLGFKEIAIVGADHSWMETLGVDSQNRLVAVQRHFYEESKSEQGRVSTEYQGYRLHQILESMAIAFRSYHLIQNFAKTKNVLIYNATPSSYIDAFERRPLE